MTIIIIKSENDFSSSDALLYWTAAPTNQSYIVCSFRLFAPNTTICSNDFGYTCTKTMGTIADMYIMCMRIDIVSPRNFSARLSGEKQNNNNNNNNNKKNNIEI